MERRNGLPQGLFEGVSDDNAEERSARLARFLVLEEMGFFGEQTNLTLASGQYNGTFIGAVRKRFSGMYGNVDGCGIADLEVAADMLGVYDDIPDMGPR